MARLDYKKLNSTLRYLMFSVFTVTPGQLGEDRDAVAADLEEFLARYDGTDVVVRGLYDISGLRAEADFMIWTHSEHIEDLQRFYNEFRRTTILGRASTAYWSNTALHRPAEFNKSHIPAFLAEEEPGAYVSVYPFVRSYEWYLLPDEERRQILAQHGRAAPQLDRIVDLMREMRATEARRHVREEIPFFTGPRVTAGQLAASVP